MMRRVNEHKWIEVKKTRKTNRNNLVSEEPAPVQCSNEYEALKNVTINSDPQEEFGNKETDEVEPKNLKLNRETDEMEPKSTMKNKKARRLQQKMERLQLNAAEEAFFTSCIEEAEEEQTAAALQDVQNIWRRAEEQHTQHPTIKLNIKSTSREVSYRAQNFIKGIVNDVMGDKGDTYS